MGRRIVLSCSLHKLCGFIHSPTLVRDVWRIDHCWLHDSQLNVLHEKWADPESWLLVYVDSLSLPPPKRYMMSRIQSWWTAQVRSSRGHHASTFSYEHQPRSSLALLVSGPCTPRRRVLNHGNGEQWLYKSRTQRFILWYPGWWSSLDPWRYLLLWHFGTTFFTGEWWHLSYLAMFVRFLFPDSPTNAWFLTPVERAIAVRRIKVNLVSFSINFVWSSLGKPNRSWKQALQERTVSPSSSSTIPISIWW